MLALSSGGDNFVLPSFCLATQAKESNMSTKKGRFTLDSVEPVQYLPDLPKIVEMWLNREDRAYSIVRLLA